MPDGQCPKSSKGTIVSHPTAWTNNMPSWWWFWRISLRSVRPSQRTYESLTDVCVQHRPPAKRLSSVGWTTKCAKVKETSELVPWVTHELKELEKERAECGQTFRMSMAIPLQPEHQDVVQSKHTRVFAMQCLHTVTMWAVGHSFASLEDVCLFFRDTVTDGHSASRQLFIRHTQALVMFTV